MPIKTLYFEEFVEAPVERVWETMLGEGTYTEWTSVFAEGSCFEGDWSEGSEIKLLDPASGSGMFAEIAENKKYERLSIRHLGWIHKGKVDTDSDDVKSWAPAYENYLFEEKGGGTLVKIEQDVLPDYEEMMTRIWPKALKKLKEICES